MCYHQTTSRVPSRQDKQGTGRRGTRTVHASSEGDTDTFQVKLSRKLTRKKLATVVAAGQETRVRASFCPIGFLRPQVNVMHYSKMHVSSGPP